MGAWRSLASPKLRIPFELREVSGPGAAERVWEVQELRKGSMFKVTIPSRVGGRGRQHVPDAALEHAVCLAVEDALMSPPDKEPGETYEVAVTDEHLEEPPR